MRALSIACTLAFAVMAGFFFAFSAAVMPGLAALAPGEAARSMQQINAAVSNPLFAMGFWGAASLAVAGCLAAPIVRAHGWPWLFLASATYLTGVFAVTAIGNVPLNRELAEIAEIAALETRWPDYAARWEALNLLRMAASFIAAGGALVALVRSVRAGAAHVPERNGTYR